MATQGRCRRDAEDVIEAVGATKIENLGSAIMAVGAQQDFGVEPARADCAQQSAQKGFDLFAARPLGRTKERSDEPASTVKHDDGLEAVLVVMGVEQPQLLIAVDGVDGSTSSP
jgi:hypothetical protein